MPRAARKPRLAVVANPIKLRIGLGEEPGFTTIASHRDLANYEANSVEEMFSPFVFHRLDNAERWDFMNEVWRVLMPTKIIKLIVPYYTSHLAISDPLAKWPPLCEASFAWYSKAWREAENMTDLPLRCNFGSPGNPHAGPVIGHENDPDVAVRAEEYRAHAAKHMWNAVHKRHVTLTKLSDT